MTNATWWVATECSCYPRPSWRHATPASTFENLSSQTVPQTPLCLTSKRPSRAVVPPTSLSSAICHYVRKSSFDIVNNTAIRPQYCNPANGSYSHSVACRRPNAPVICQRRRRSQRGASAPSPTVDWVDFLRQKLALLGRRACFIQ